MINRDIETKVNEYLNSESTKIFFIWGPRRSGKTTVLKDLASKLDLKIYNFDILDQSRLFKPERQALQDIVRNNKVLLIDEVQNNPESTVALKILFDEFNIKIIATGSSEIRQKSNQFDSLAGRYTDNYCLPLTVGEKWQSLNEPQYMQEAFAKNTVANTCTFGAYPEIFATTANDEVKYEVLQNILSTYVLKDVISIYNLKDLKLATDILTKLALQIGSEVSLREIANSLQANATTVANYIEVFVKNYILIPLPSFKTNLRNAVSENKKYFFMDLGIRNTLIKDFRQLELRQDAGGVFENFIISELYKIKLTNKKFVNFYFYREYNGRELDLVLEDYKKNYKSIEIKLNATVNKGTIFPISNEFISINSQNYFGLFQDIFNFKA